MRTITLFSCNKEAIFSHFWCLSCPDHTILTFLPSDQNLCPTVFLDHTNPKKPGYLDFSVDIYLLLFAKTWAIIVQMAFSPYEIRWSLICKPLHYDVNVERSAINKLQWLVNSTISSTHSGLLRTSALSQFQFHICLLGRVFPNIYLLKV